MFGKREPRWFPLTQSPLTRKEMVMIQTIKCTQSRMEQILATVPQKVLDRYCRENHFSRPKAIRHYRELVKFLLACAETGAFVVHESNH